MHVYVYVEQAHFAMGMHQSLLYIESKENIVGYLSFICIHNTQTPIWIDFCSYVTRIYRFGLAIYRIFGLFSKQILLYTMLRSKITHTLHLANEKWNVRNRREGILYCDDNINNNNNDNHDDDDDCYDFYTNILPIFIFITKFVSISEPKYIDTFYMVCVYACMDDDDGDDERKGERKHVHGDG